VSGSDVASRLATISQQVAKNPFMGITLSEDEHDDEDNPLAQSTTSTPKAPVGQPTVTQSAGEKDTPKHSSSDDSSEELAVHEDQEEASADDE
jgi:hypothetical protein